MKSKFVVKKPKVLNIRTGWSICGNYCAVEDRMIIINVCSVAEIKVCKAPADEMNASTMVRRPETKRYDNENCIESEK